MIAFDYLCVIECPHAVPNPKAYIAAINTSSVCSLMALTNVMES